MVAIVTNDTLGATTRRRACTGFTLLELMTAVAVVAVLLGIAIPSYNAIIARNRVTAATNELLAGLALARSEAIKRAARVSICSSNATQTECAGGNDWSSGWLIFSDLQGDAGVIERVGAEPDQIMQRSAQSGSMLLTGDAPFMSYLPNGSANETQAFTIRHRSCSGNEARIVSVSLPGRASAAVAPCS